MAEVKFPSDPRFVNLIGRRFGRLTVIRYIGWRNGRPPAIWLCRCECGNEKQVARNNLVNGRIKSCKCLMRERTGERSTTHGHKKGRKVTREYVAFQAAKDRCSNAANQAYRNYGGRGIEFRFGSFEEFLAYLGPKPSPKHSLDRYPNVNGHYEPGNVRWATATEQQNNKRNNRVIEFRGEKATTAEWCRRLGVPVQLVFQRLHYGWCDECALTTPLVTSSRNKKRCPHNSNRQTKRLRRNGLSCPAAKGETNPSAESS